MGFYLNPDTGMITIYHNRERHETLQIPKEAYDLIACQAKALEIVRNNIRVKPPEGAIVLTPEDIDNFYNATEDEFFMKELVEDKRNLMNKCKNFCCKLKDYCPRFNSADGIVKIFGNFE